MGLGAPVMSALYWLRRDGAVGVQYTIAGSSRYAPSDQTRCAGSAIVGTLYEIGGKEKYGAEKYGAQKIRGPKNTKNTKNTQKIQKIRGLVLQSHILGTGGRTYLLTGLKEKE